VPPQGLERVAKTTGKTGIPDSGGAECGALGAQNAPSDPDLAAVVDAWPTLPEAVRTAILAMVKARVEG
jgi:hypothetical protein